MNVFRLRVALRWKEPVWRVIEIRGDQTLHEFHYAIQRAFDWDNDHMYSFFMSGRAWDKASEYVSPDAQNEQSLFRKPSPTANQAYFSGLGLSPGAKFLYIFDYGDQWNHNMELLEILEADPNITYPKITERHGEAPEQYPEEDYMPDISPKEALKALGPDAALAPKIEAAINASCAEDMSRAGLENQYALAVELYETIRRRDSGRRSIAEKVKGHLVEPAKRIIGIAGKPSQDAMREHEYSAFRLFEIALERCGLIDWLIPMPLCLANGGMAKEGAELARLWSAITDAENFLGDRAVILAEAGLEQEARAQILENLTRFPGDTWIQIKAGDAYRAIRDFNAAEPLYRKALEAAEDSYDRPGILERLIPLLREAGKTAEADTLEAAEQKRIEEFRAKWMPHVRQQPKIGRNESCPCGSGKKYKKCCLEKEKDKDKDKETIKRPTSDPKSA